METIGTAWLRGSKPKSPGRRFPKPSTKEQVQGLGFAGAEAVGRFRRSLGKATSAVGETTLRKKAQDLSLGNKKRLHRHLSELNGCFKEPYTYWGLHGVL